MKNFVNNLKMNTVATFAAMMMTIAAMNAQQDVEQFVFEVTTTAENQAPKKISSHAENFFPKNFALPKNTTIFAAFFKPKIVILKWKH